MDDNQDPDTEMHSRSENFLSLDSDYLDPDQPPLFKPSRRAKHAAGSLELEEEDCYCAAKTEDCCCPNRRHLLLLPQWRKGFFCDGRAIALLPKLGAAAGYFDSGRSNGVVVAGERIVVAIGLALADECVF